MRLRVFGCVVLVAVRAPLIADIHTLKLDGSGATERLTYFADVPTYRASNPVVSDDGRDMAFQMGRSGGRQASCTTSRRQPTNCAR